MMVLPHLRLVLPLSSRYLTTAISLDNPLTDMCGPGLGKPRATPGPRGRPRRPAHYGNSLGFRIVPLDGVRLHAFQLREICSNFPAS
jgi:hypothetical protein